MCFAKQYQACAECTRKCVEVHGKKSVSLGEESFSFFKIMWGSFRSILFIPPEFRGKIESLVDQNVYLEDSEGRTWNVRISTVKNSLVFDQGWDQFIEDHGIELGEMVTFSYYGMSSFVIQIFGISGCQRVKFPSKRNSNTINRKRQRVDSSCGHLDTHMVGKASDSSEPKCQTISEDYVNRKKTALTRSTGFSKLSNNLATPEKSSHLSESFQRSQPALAIKYTEALHQIVAEKATGSKQVNDAISYVCADVDMDRGISNHALDSKNFSFQSFQGANLERGEGCKRNLVTSNGILDKEHLTKRQVPAVDKSEVIKISPVCPTASEVGETRMIFGSVCELTLNKKQACGQCREPLGNSGCESNKKLGVDIPVNSIVTEVAETKCAAESSWFRRGCGTPSSQVSGKKTVTVHEYKSEKKENITVLNEKSCFMNLRMNPCLPKVCTDDKLENPILLGDCNCKILVTEDGTCIIIEEDPVMELSPIRVKPIHVDISEMSVNLHKADNTLLTKDTFSNHQKKPRQPRKAFNIPAKPSITLECDDDKHGNNVICADTCRKDGNSATCESISIKDGDGACEIISTKNGTGASCESIFIKNGNGATHENISKKNDTYAACEDNCTKDVGVQPLGNTNVSCVEHGPHNTTIIPTLHENPGDIGHSHYHFEEEEKKVIPYSKGKSFAVVKTELVDSLMLLSPSPVRLSFSVTATAQPWHELPEALPSKRKRHERKVVLLRDSTMQVWPILYLESTRFIGFLGGWQCFASAHNLQEGDVCALEMVNEAESMFGVVICRK